MNQVSKTPNNIAIESENEKVTYSNLEDKVNRCACIIKSHVKSSGNAIGVCMDKSSDMVAVIIAILKTNNIYVPLDIGYPDERLEYIMNDAGIEFLFLDRNKDTKIPFSRKVNMYIDSNYNQKSSDYSYRNSIAYIMYTSGTTGDPKGVLTTHANVLSRTLNPNYVSILNQDKILYGSNYCFDASSFEIFASLLNGATLVIPKEQGMTYLYQLPNIIYKYEISICFFTTSLFNILVERSLDSLKKVRVLLFGGEKASVKHVNVANTSLDNTEIIHVYGPTETTIFATYHVLNKMKIYSDAIPIGKPVDKTNVKISHQDNELLISGEGVSLGYLNKKNITDKKFVLPSNEKKRVYKTGDKVQYNSHGELIYNGRIDNQVKIRGFRIELEEVENVLERHKMINEAYVTYTKDKLIAFLRVNNNFNREDVYIYLNKKLPKYTIPSQIKKVSEFPLTNNGKIDKKRLLDLI